MATSSTPDGSAVARSAQDGTKFLRTFVLGTARSTGDEFFRSVRQNLADAVNVRWGFLAVFSACGIVESETFRLASR